MMLDNDVLERIKDKEHTDTETLINDYDMFLKWIAWCVCDEGNEESNVELLCRRLTKAGYLVLEDNLYKTLNETDKTLDEIEPYMMLNTDRVYCIMRNDHIEGYTHLCGVFLDGHEASEIFDKIVEYLVNCYKNKLNWKDCEAKYATDIYHPNFVKAVTINVSEDLWERMWIEERILNRYSI